jgi:hypothetical protein
MSFAMTSAPSRRLWLVAALATLFAPLACGGPTFVVAQYPGPTRPRNTIAILRTDGGSKIQLVSVDGEALAPIADDVRLHIEVLPGEHSVGVANLGRSDQPAQRVRFFAEAGRLYGPAWGGLGPQIFELDVDSGAPLRDVTMTAPAPLPHEAQPAPPPQPPPPPPPVDTPPTPAPEPPPAEPPDAAPQPPSM